MKYKRSFLLSLMLLLVLTGCGKGKTAEVTQSLPVETPAVQQETEEADPAEENDFAATEEAEDIAATISIDRDGKYDSRDDVAIYLHEYGELPENYITKKEAKALKKAGGGENADPAETENTNTENIQAEERMAANG